MTENTAEDGTEGPAVPFIRRVRIKNYKSIAECDVRLGPLTVLVGPNGAGKSNFLDALAFMARALETTPAEVIDERGGLREILRRVPQRAESFSILVDTVIPWWPSSPEYRVTYGFEIASSNLRDSGFEVAKEECLVRGGESEDGFTLRNGSGDISSSGTSFTAKGIPDQLGIDCTIEPVSVGEYRTVSLKTRVNGDEFEFSPLGMSEGTIRGAAVLAALFQPEALDGRLPLIAIEEPEAALHPAAAGALFDALTEAAEHVQIIAASQSADLLDREDFDVSAIRPVAMQDGLTVIGEVDDASREIAREKLMTLGELMRGNQLVPSPPQHTDSGW
jgi:predicted ATPase